MVKFLGIYAIRINSMRPIMLVEKETNAEHKQNERQIYVWQLSNCEIVKQSQ